MAPNPARALVARVVSQFGGGKPSRPKAPRRPSVTPENFERSINRRGRGCWKWKGPLDVNGAAYVRVDGKRMVAHRYMWLVVLGRDLKPGERVYRTCRNKVCTRPDHLDVRRAQGA